MNFFFILVTALMLCSCASYPFQDWSTADIVRQSALVAFDVVDWAQTNEIVIAGSLKPGPWREGFQLISIGCSAYTTVNNRKIGVKP